MSLTTTDERALTGVEDFAEALTELSRRHYQRNGSELLTNLAEDELARKQYARLLGVILKQPFTVEVPRKKSIKTHSVIALRWRDEGKEGPRLSVSALPEETSHLWQHRFLSALAKAERPDVPTKDALRLLLQDARYESRLGEHIFRAFHRYLCDGGPNAKAIKKAVGAAKKKGRQSPKRKAL